MQIIPQLVRQYQARYQKNFVDENAEEVCGGIVTRRSAVADEVDSLRKTLGLDQVLNELYAVPQTRFRARRRSDLRKEISHM